MDSSSEQLVSREEGWLLVSLIGTGLFGPLAKIYAATLIEMFGWRMAYVGVGFLPFWIAFPVAWFLLHEAN